MSSKRGGLGRNLSALLSPTHSQGITAHAIDERQVQRINCNQLQPGKYQPRSDIDDEHLSELTESIKKQGLLQPIVVREIAQDQYEIIAGERRWRACQLAGMSDIPSLIHQVDDETAMAMALVENLQREDLNVMDQARAMQRLIQEFNLTHQQIAELLSKSRTVVSNYLRLLQLNPTVMQMLECNDLDMGHARCLLGLEVHQQTEVARLIVAKNLSVRETEALVARIKISKPEKIFAPPPLRFEQLLQSLAKQFQAPVKLKTNKTGEGQLIIHYANEQGLEKVLRVIETAAKDL